jgi:Stress responsive A/B Barrel Domain
MARAAWPFDNRPDPGRAYPICKTDRGAHMIVHILRFTFKDSATEQQKADGLDALERFSEMDSVAFSVAGQYMGDPADGFTHGLCVGITDIRAFEHYQREPIHRVADFVLHPTIAKVDSFDISNDLDPALGQAITDVITRRLASDPELATLLSKIPDNGGLFARQVRG